MEAKTYCIFIYLLNFSSLIFYFLWEKESLDYTSCTPFWCLVWQIVVKFCWAAPLTFSNDCPFYVSLNKRCSWISSKSQFIFRWRIYSMNNSPQLQMPTRKGTSVKNKPLKLEEWIMVVCGLYFLYSKLWEDLSGNSYLITIEEALSCSPPTLFVSVAPQEQGRLVVKIPQSLENQVSTQNLKILE